MRTQNDRRPTFQRRPGPLSALFGILLFFALLAPLGAQEAPRDEGAEPGAETPALRVAIDRETGELRPPTPEESARLSREILAWLSQTAVEPTVVQHPDGTLAAVVPDHLMSFLAVTRDGAGELAFHCGDPPAPDAAGEPAKPEREEVEP